MKQKLMKVAGVIKAAWGMCKALGYIFVWPGFLLFNLIMWGNDIFKGLNGKH